MPGNAFVTFMKGEFAGWGRLERIIFPFVIIALAVISFSINDNKIALVSAVCGISYTILAGKGKISCYFIGACGSLCYCWIAYKNGLYGNLGLYMLYYLPMQIIGIFKWRKHLKKDRQEIIKISLPKKESIIYFVLALAGTFFVWLVLCYLGGSAPFADAFSVVFSILGMYLTVRRAYEQWIVWFFVNAVSLYMWIVAYINGSNCFATVFMWAVYLVLAVYFMIAWKKELRKTADLQN